MVLEITTKAKINAFSREENSRVRKDKRRKRIVFI